MGTKRTQKFKFDFRHLLVLFGVLITFQITVSYLYRGSLHSFLTKTQDWYQNYSALRMANLTTTSLELLVESSQIDKNMSESSIIKMTQKFDIIFSQQLMEKNVDEISLFLYQDNEFHIIDDGSVLFNYMRKELDQIPAPHITQTTARKYFDSIKTEMINTHSIQSIIEENNKFHVFVPFVPNGEFRGAVYMKNTPNFAVITNEFISNFDDMAVVFSSLILIGLFFMYQISSHTVKERNKTHELLIKEHEKFVEERVAHEKESVFTKRIYHTYHKAAKIIGYIIEDLSNLHASNIEKIKTRVTKYSEFISRVIYDMKWTTPQLYTTMNPLFSTDVNEVIEFIIKDIFLRIAKPSKMYSIDLSLDKNLPLINVNEYVLWEIIEPLVQNSIAHNSDREVKILVKTEFLQIEKLIKIIVEDDGKGITGDQLLTNEKGIQNIFLEDTSTSKLTEEHAGYGCYLVYNLTVNHCGWKIRADNLPDKGCRFELAINI